MKYDIVPPIIATTQPETPVTDDKLIVKYGEKPNIIDDTNAEISALIIATQDSSAKNEARVKAMNTNGEYYFCVYFQDMEQKDSFIEKMKLTDITAGQFINGIEFANKLGITIEKKELKKPGKFNTFKI